MTTATQLFSTNQVREAYEQAAGELDLYYQLTAAIRLRMCTILDCNPRDLQDWIESATDEQFERAIF